MAHDLRRGILTLGLALGLSLAGGVAGAQSLRNGNLSGTLVTASGGDGDTLVTAPADRPLVLTLFCSEDLRSVRLTAASLLVPQPIEPANCTEYRPGIVIPPGVGLKCEHTGNFGFGNHCMVTAVVTK